MYASERLLSITKKNGLMFNLTGPSEYFSYEWDEPSTVGAGFNRLI